MTTDHHHLIVESPHLRRPRSVQFAETSKLHAYERHDVARHELWYTKAEYILMKRAITEAVLKFRAGRTANEAPANDDTSAEEESSRCFIGIEHLLTPACMEEVRACRARCTHAVLVEQARQDPSARFGLETIALASYTQTRQPVMRARKLGNLHQGSI